jgi:hypothetical protein
MGLLRNLRNLSLSLNLRNLNLRNLILNQCEVLGAVMRTIPFGRIKKAASHKARL